MQTAVGLAPRREDESDQPKPHEMRTLGLDPANAAATLGWRARLDPAATTARWYAARHAGASVRDLTLDQIRAFAALPNVDD